MSRIKNVNVVYNGKPGAPRPKRYQTVRTSRATPVKCLDGPLEGETLYLCDYVNTLRFTLGNRTGYYHDGRWNGS